MSLSHHCSCFFGFGFGFLDAPGVFFCFFFVFFILLCLEEHSYIYFLPASSLFIYLLELIYNVPISAVQQSDPIVYVCMCVCVPFLILSAIMVSPKRMNITPCAA